MKITISSEHGFKEALTGIWLSYHSLDSFSPEKAAEIASKLCGRDGGHNKFLESMFVWMNIQAPRYWWQQFDTYRSGVTKLSASTMHTLTGRHLEQTDFERPIASQTLARLNQLIDIKDLLQVKLELPEGFLQERMVCANYKALRNMVQQRKTHKLPEWHQFIGAMKQLEHWEFLE